MSNEYVDEPILNMYIFETSQQLDQLERSVLAGEKSKCYAADAINEIFRIMHTIKGSSALMHFNSIASIAHAMEDLFFYIREGEVHEYDGSALSDLILEGVDFIKVELDKIKAGDKADGVASALLENINCYLDLLKQGNPSPSTDGNNTQPFNNTQQLGIPQLLESAFSSSKVYKAVVFFEDDCEMENIRAFTIIHKLKNVTEEIIYFPADIIENDNCILSIREQGFKIVFKVDKSYEEMQEFFLQTIYLKSLELKQLKDEEELKQLHMQMKIDMVEVLDGKQDLQKKREKEEKDRKLQAPVSEGVISVSLSKLNKLMDLLGEMVVAESMVTQNPDLKDLALDNFHKAARQLNKITGELQDMVMSLRMVPISATFQKMHRIVRDMSKKLDKEIKLEILGEDTEVDKNIVEHIADPLMHLVRNSIDHGLELPVERIEKGKSRVGTVTLEARNEGSDIVILVKDDGRGLNKVKILRQAADKGLLHKPEGEMSDSEIYSLVFLPGFSTKESITEFSGRGVGMDVVTKNIEAVGGAVSVDGIHEKGTTVKIKIPLTLAIIDGMNIRVGSSRYTIPITSITESFRPKETDIIRDPEGHEMIMVRGQCYLILRLHELYSVKPDKVHIQEGIVVMVESGSRTLCIFADELLGEQQVVVKALPRYLKKVKGLSGCTLLGDGGISLILDVAGLVRN